MSAFNKEYVSAKEAIDLLRLQKHDFLNYIQIISGYLQLGNVEKAQTYVEKATTELDRSGSITKMANPALGLNLLLRVYKAYTNQGVVIDMYASTNLEFFVYDSRAAELFDRILSAIEGVSPVDQEEKRVRIIFREIEEAYWMQISILPFEANAFNRLRERLEEAAVDLGYDIAVAESPEDESGRVDVCLVKNIRSG